jgi:hypothetical protein
MIIMDGPLDEFMNLIQNLAYQLNERYDKWKDNPDVIKFINNDFYKKMKCVNCYTDGRTAQCYYLAFTIFLWCMINKKMIHLK